MKKAKVSTGKSGNGVGKKGGIKIKSKVRAGKIALNHNAAKIDAI